ncbi:hypothetical protein ON010_g12997 [Phytophthora cinnamomi]|nr:hypothetical protein ON010_g12997 [Phytophthora cinnamomi]
MGNRFSRKKTKQQASAAGAAASQKEAVVAVLTSAPLVSELSDSGAPKDEKVEVVLPLSARQAPPTARDGSEGSPVDFFRRCYELEEDPFTLYTQALLLKDQREFAAARGPQPPGAVPHRPGPSAELVPRGGCAVPRGRDSGDELCVQQRGLLPLHHVSRELGKAQPLAVSMGKPRLLSLELPLCVGAAGPRDDSRQALRPRSTAARCAGRLGLVQQAELNSDASVSAALRQQQTLVSFQRAFCRYALGDSPDAVSAELLRVLPQKLEPTKEAQAQQPEQQQQQQQHSDNQRDQCIEEEKLSPTFGHAPHIHIPEPLQATDSPHPEPTYDELKETAMLLSFPDRDRDSAEQ